MTQVNIKDDILNKIKKESELTGIKMGKLVEISFGIYLNKDIKGMIDKEISKIRDKLGLEYTEKLRREIITMRDKEQEKYKGIVEKYNNLKKQYNYLLNRLESLKKK